MFPNTLLAISAGWFQVISPQPDAVDRSAEFLGLYLMGEVAQENRADTEAFSSMMNEINQQDVALLRRLQVGRSSPAADRGVSLPYWERAARQFHARVRAALPPTPAPGAAPGPG